jgi:regulator of sigma E protease
LELTQLLPQFGNAAFTIIAFILALSIIVAIHEYGHYIVGRWSGIHAEVFSLGFGPVLFSRVDRHGTRWQIAALPFGGFVKFLGDANAASVGSVEIPAEERRHTMLGAPLWARAATVLAGPVFNFILSALVFGAVLMGQGQIADPLRIAALQPLPPVLGQGMRPGDQITAIDGHPTPTLDSMNAIQADLPLAGDIAYTVLRDGAEVQVVGPHPYPPLVLGVTPGSAAYDAGLQADDVITAVDGVPVWSFDQLVQIVIGGEGKAMLLSVWRDGTDLTFTIIPRRADLPTEGGGFETRWLVGVSGGLVFELKTETPGLLTTAGRAFGQIGSIVLGSLSGLYHMVTGAISSCNLSGPVGIAQASGAMAAQGAVSFIWFVGVLSTAVGLMNLFPIPVLDGGHLVFHAYEAVTGRKPGVKALNILMVAGLALVLFLTLFALANDLFLCP